MPGRERLGTGRTNREGVTPRPEPLSGRPATSRPATTRETHRASPPALADAGGRALASARGLSRADSAGGTHFSGESCAGTARFGVVPEKNQYARPFLSKANPLRSVFLSDDANTIPRSRTQSELRRSYKTMNLPHPSFDIDGDGYVSQMDFNLAKRFDANGNGLLDAEEQAIGRRIIAEEFFEGHANDLAAYGSDFATRDWRANAALLAKSNSFERTLRGLRAREKKLTNSGSAFMRASMASAPELTVHNFYTDKADADAYTDYGARGPRALQRAVHGSRKDLLQRRRQADRATCAARLDHLFKPSANKRVSLMTNWAIENN